MRLCPLLAAPALAMGLLLASASAGSASLDRRAGRATDNAEGFWFATMPSGVNVKWAILDGGETWGIYEAQGTILGAFHGVTQSANGALHGSGLAFDIPSSTLGNTHFSGSYLARHAITLTTTFGTTISGRYAPGYDQPARLADLQGHYQGEGLGSRSPVIGMNLRVGSNGALVLTSRQDCAASGTATPRPSGKNVFNVSLRFAGGACAMGDGTAASGIAYLNTASGELFVLALNAARTDGWLYLGAVQVE